MIGFRSHLLTVVEKAVKPSTTKDRSFFWKCLCDCGNETTLSTANLKIGRTKSCGCYKETTEYKNSITKRNQNSLEKVATARIYSSYKSSALLRGISFSLELDYFKSLIKDSCFYCGTSYSNTRMLQRKFGHKEFKYNGIDRIDNKQGYIESNTVSCCRTCNTAKMEQTTEEFISWIQRVYHQIQSK